MGRKAPAGRPIQPRRRRRRGHRDLEPRHARILNAFPFEPGDLEDFASSTEYPVNGGPGIRRFVLDPDGDDVEAVFHEPRD